MIKTDAKVFPFVAGHKGTDTAIAAADAVNENIAHVQRLVLEAVAATGSLGGTAEELSERLKRSRYTVQPRTTELRLLGKIVDSGIRRRNASGRNAIVWRIAGAFPEFGEAANG